MTLTASSAPTAPSPQLPRRSGLVALIVAAGLAASGLGAGLGLSLGGSSAPSGSSPSSAYDYYQSAVDRYWIGSMMGGNYEWMMGPSGYSWMMGGANAPAWMRGQDLPGFMMGAGGDPGKVMGRLFADAPGPRVSPAQAARLGYAAPAGATADHGANRLVFSTTSVDLVVLASPSMPGESFRIAGMINPVVVVPSGAEVRIELVNADGDMAHGFVVAAQGAASSPMPMMTAAPAFPGAALWFLGESTSAGVHTGTLSFAASTAGTYQYLCPVPGHAEEGMAGTFVVSPAR